MFRNGIVLLILFLVHINGEEQDVPQQFLRAFESLPTLLQHVINMLQEKPETLEKNDFTSFLESNVDVRQREVFKREYNTEDYDDNKDKPQELYDWYLLKADSESNYGGFIGSMSGGFQLTADEIAEGMLMVERKLDEYYNDTN